MSSPRVLVVEDDEFVQSLLASLLDNAGFSTLRVGSSRELLTMLRDVVFDLVLLDLGLPDEDGLDALRKLRAQSDVPVIILTNRKELEDRIAALEIGADDFVTKPIEPKELTLRVGRLIERTGPAQTRANAHRIEMGPWTLDSAERRLTHREQGEIQLTRSEFNLLESFFRAPNRVQSRELLLESLNRNGADPYDRTVDVLVSRLRKKLNVGSRQSTFIQTVQGIGYRLNLDEVETADP
ncbi:MAG: response regulator transcription factor [Pseudomonadota bacterium]